MAEDIGCVVGGTLLILCSIGLSRLRAPEWMELDTETDSPNKPYRLSKLQRGIRLFNNAVIASIGLGIISAAFVPHGRSWVLLWCGVLALAMLCVLLALLDALLSLAGYRKALPEAARRSFIDQQ